jgi:hypothetical protein
MSQIRGPKDPSDPIADLPPVEPPTAGFIVQLFVIPAIVVAVVVVVWLLFGKLAGGERDATDYVRTIRSENVNRRWRAAYDLASLIQNDKGLARDPKLVGELAGLLDEELDRKGGDPEVCRYLAFALGGFQTLQAQASGGRQADPLATLARALAPEVPTEVRTAAALSLGRLGAESPDGLDHDAVARALIKALDDPGPEPKVRELRQRAAYTLGYVRGPAAVQALRRVVAEDEDRDVRYNAAVALARRGEPAARSVLREMLSPADLAQVVKGETGSEARRRIEAIELEALWALQGSVKQHHPDLAQSVRLDIQSLAHSGPPAVRVEAETLLKSLPPTR